MTQPGRAVISLIRETFAPALIGRDAAMVEKIWRDLSFLTHATTVGAIALALAATIPRYPTCAAARPGRRCT